MKKLTLLFFVFHFSLFTFHLSEAQVIHVPADHPTIQQGIDASSDGDTVLVAENTYYENINFNGRAILLASEFILDGDTSHISNTIVNGSQPFDPNYGSVVYFLSGEDTTSVLCGFTITGGTGTLFIEVPFRIGGGVCIQYSGGKLENNYIEYNEIHTDYWAMGGGIVAGGPLNPNPWVVLRNNRISHNKAISYGDEGDGGGFDIWYNLVLEGNEVSYNEANGTWRGDGGAGRAFAGFGPIVVSIKDNLVTRNLAVSTNEGTDLVLGGGLDFFGDCSGVVSGNEISFNQIEVSADKTGYGMGVMVELADVVSPDFIFENNRVMNNTFTGGYCVGGGLCIYTSGGKFQNNIIQNNKATYGGAISLQYNTDVNQAVFINNTLTGNEATAYGGGMHVISANAVVINTIIWGNTAPNDASIYEELSALEVMYSDVEGESDWPGEGNIRINPGFLDDTCHIDENSPCEDHGTPSLYIGQNWYDIPDTDFEGTIRPWHMGYDIGADECDIIIKVPDLRTNNNDLTSVQIYPNPFSSITTIEYEIKEAGSVTLKIFNNIGQEVARLVNEHQSKGTHQVRWNAEGLPTGIYFYRLAVGGKWSAVGGKIVKY